MGKTSISLKAFQVLLEAKTARVMLVIAPKKACNLVWPAEREKWTDFHSLRMSKVVGTEEEREKALAREADIYVINPENLDWLIEKERGRRFWDMAPDVLCVDESSKFRNPKSVRFALLRSVLNQFRRRWILTGSPRPKGYLDLWSQIFILDRGSALSTHVSHYRNEYFYSTGFGGYTWKLNEGAEKKITRKIKDLAIYMSAEDYLDMPEEIPNVIRVELPEDARKLYDEMEEDMFAVLDSGKTITAVSGAVASMKCAQIANGGVFVDVTGKKKEWKLIHNEKTEAIEDLVEELNGAPILVAYEFSHDLERLREAFGKNVPWIGGGSTEANDEKITRAWNEGEIEGPLLGQPSAMGHALNLQGEGAGNNIAFHSIVWDYEIYDQFIRRVRRSGLLHKKVIVHHIVATDTVDEPKMRSLAFKKKGQDKFLYSLKEYALKRRKQRQ